MVKLTSEIKICSANSSNDLIFRNINEVRVVTSVENLTDTCVIKIPRKIEYQTKPITDYIKRGDGVEVRLGYDDDLELVFKGYVKRVETGTPLIIECENEAWKLKEVFIEPKAYDNFNVKSFVEEVLKGYNTKVTSIPLGNINISERVSVLQALNVLKKDYNFKFFFRENVKGITEFFGGMVYTELATENKPAIDFKAGKNIVSTALKYTLKEDIKIQIISKNVILKDGKNLKIEAKYPEITTEGYSTQTYHVYSALDEKTLKEDAKRRHDDVNIDTMDGSFTVFGKPFVRKGDRVRLLDDQNEELNNKTFFAKSVTYSFGVGGYRQIIELGGKAS